MGRLRLIITVEGQTEQTFVRRVITPHLSAREIDASARLLVTNRRLGARGGVMRYSQVKSDLQRLLKQHHGDNVRFTSMIDLYALPEDFPGKATASSLPDAVARVEYLERAMADDLSDPRFIPFIQLHEFESLLFCDLRELERRIDQSAGGIRSLAKDVDGLQPEDINDGESTAPSKRIIRYLPMYKRSKARVGAVAAEAIGLAVLRQRCPHFGAWLSRLEEMGGR